MADAEVQAGVQPLLPNKKNRKQAPQKNVDDFWAAFTTKHGGTVHSILPHDQHAASKAKREPRGVVQSQPVKDSYEAARKECVAVVDKISKECRRINQRYRDIHFDMEFDLKNDIRDCLYTLGGPGSDDEELRPKSVKRVNQIFDDPKFYIDDATPTDIRQGYDGDCWFLSGLSACTQLKKFKFIEEICVARDEAVGVYGFVFHRDGEWIHVVVDDRLYLTAADYEESVDEKRQMIQLNNGDSEDEYKRFYQTGSKALYFAQCSNENETWLPLLEKAYAKVHGDYQSINGGYTGEAIEDLTGGITTQLWTSDILDTDRFWKEELLKVNDEFLFSCATGWSDDFLGGSSSTSRKGVYSGHAYSIMETREINGVRLCKLRNPWGKSEWKGPWSDGSAEWTPEWMELLNHRFGDDGVFWISYKDLLRKFTDFDRTRLFDREWKVSQQWTSVDVSWSQDYNATKFEVDIKEPGRCVISLSQLDERYFLGLEGQYRFALQFRVENNAERGYIARSNSQYFMNRSCSLELDLDPGTYSILLKLDAKRYGYLWTPEQMLRRYHEMKRNKMLQVGLSYDLAHAKAIPYETEDAKKARKEKAARAKAAAKAKAKKAKRDTFWEGWEESKRQIERNRRRKARQKEHKKKKAEAKKAAQEATKKEEVNETKPENFEEKKDPERESESKKVAEQSRDAGTITGKDKVKEKKELEPEQTESTTDTESKIDIQTTETIEELEKPQESTMIDKATLDAPKRSESETSSEPMDTPTTSAAPSTVSAESKHAAASAKGDTQPQQPATEAKNVDETALSTEQARKPEVPMPPEASAGAAAAEKSATLEAPTPASAPVPPSVPEAPTAPEPPSGPEARKENADDSSSDTETVYTFVTSIDTRLDSIHYPSSSSSSDSSGSEPEDTDTYDSDNEPLANDPWNAVCVVGLRVFSKNETNVRVVRPKSKDDEESPLDVDDASKAIAGDRPVAESAEVMKISVDGERPSLASRQTFKGDIGDLPMRGMASDR